MRTLFLSLFTLCLGAQMPTDALWAKTMAPLLQQPLWDDLHAYDAGDYLMVPQAWAFRSRGTQEEQTELSLFWVRWQLLGSPVPADHLTRLQFLYAASQHMRLNPARGRGLRGILGAHIQVLWATAPAIQWEHASFNGIKARTVYKLSLTNPRKSYFRAFTDEDFFLFAIAADLRAYDRAHAYSSDPVLEEIGAMTRIVCNRAFLPYEDKLYMQPGVWTDHPDYAYAGHESIYPGMLPVKLADVSPDISHQHRVPLWLRSFGDGDPDAASYYADLRHRLAGAFFGACLEKSGPFLRTTNFLDGRNGVYRFGYATTNGSGYDAWQLSGTMTSGWWAFLGDSRCKGMHQRLAAQFPLSDDALKCYVGPGTTRVQDPLCAQGYTNGFRELLCRLAGEL